jgi:hypothetical protein
MFAQPGRGDGILLRLVPQSCLVRADERVKKPSYGPMSLRMNENERKEVEKEGCTCHRLCLVIVLAMKRGYATVHKQIERGGRRVLSVHASDGGSMLWRM